LPESCKTCCGQVTPGFYKILGEKSNFVIILSNEKYYLKKCPSNSVYISNIYYKKEDAQIKRVIISLQIVILLVCLI